MGQPFSNRDQNTIVSSNTNEVSRGISYINSPTSSHDMKPPYSFRKVHSQKRRLDSKRENNDGYHGKSQGQSFDNRRPSQKENWRQDQTMRESQEIKIGTLENIIQEKINIINELETKLQRNRMKSTFDDAGTVQASIDNRTQRSGTVTDQNSTICQNQRNTQNLDRVE